MSLGKFRTGWRRRMNIQERTCIPARCRCALRRDVSRLSPTTPIVGAVVRPLRLPRFFRGCAKSFPWLRVNAPFDNFTLVFHTSCYGVSRVKEDPYTRHWSTLIHYRRFRYGTRRAERIRIPDIDDGTAACFGSEKYFRYRRRWASAACNSRTARTVLLCKQSIQRGNSLRSFFNYSAWHGEKLRCIAAMQGSNGER